MVRLKCIPTVINAAPEINLSFFLGIKTFITNPKTGINNNRCNTNFIIFHFLITSQEYFYLLIQLILLDLESSELLN